MFLEELCQESGGTPDPTAFLQYYRELNDNIDYAITKQFTVDIDVTP